MRIRPGNRPTRRSLLVALLFVVPAACGTPAPPGNGDGGNGTDDLTMVTAPTKVGDACKQLFGEIRAQAIACGNGFDLLFTVELVDYTCNNFQKLEDAGTIHYDKDAFLACDALVRAQACVSLNDPNISATCQKAFAGTKTGGASCISSNECISGSCNTGTGCPGTCSSVADIGGDCSMTSCKSTLVCASTMKCVTPNTEGQSCASAGCIATLYCEPSTMICRAKKNAGGDCTNASDACVTGLTCKSNTCVAPKKVGESCTGEMSVCSLGAYCDTTCKLLPKLGETCGSVGNMVLGCLEGYCKRVPTDMGLPPTGTCVAKIAEGGACDARLSSSDCALGTRCIADKCTKTQCF